MIKAQSIMTLDQRNYLKLKLFSGFPITHRSSAWCQFPEYSNCLLNWNHNESELKNRLLFLLIGSFREHIFLTRMWWLKNGWPLSSPPKPIFYHLQLPKKDLISFDEIWRNTSRVRTRWLDSPPPICFRVKSLKK